MQNTILSNAFLTFDFAISKIPFSLMLFFKIPLLKMAFSVGLLVSRAFGGEGRGYGELSLGLCLTTSGIMVNYV